MQRHNNPDYRAEKRLVRVMARISAKQRPLPSFGFVDLGPGPHIGTDDGGVTETWDEERQEWIERP